MRVDKQTLTIVTAALGLIATAAILSARNRPPGASPKEEGLCGGPARAPAQASMDLGFGKAAFALSHAKVLHAGDGQVYLSVDVDVPETTGQARAPVALAIVIDRSGSMAGEKLAQAKQAARGIVERLEPRDHLALVRYDDTAQVLVALTPMDAEGKKRVTAAIDAVMDGGGTNLNAGMVLGIEELRRRLADGRLSRLILLSDGQANVGVVDTPVMARTAGAAADAGIRITTVGLGLDYNEDLLEALAENGRGRYYYVRDAAGLESVFAGELRALTATVAKNVELRLEPTCSGVEIAEVFGYATRTDGNALIVPFADLSGGDKRKVVVRMRIPSHREGRADIVRATMGYDDPDGRTGRKQAMAALGLSVTADAESVREAANRDVLTNVETVLAAKSLREATAAYERGDQDGAARIVEEQHQRSEAQAATYGLDEAKLRPALENLKSNAAGYMNAKPESPEGTHIRKQGKLDARKFEK